MTHSSPRKLYSMMKGISTFLDHINIHYDEEGIHFQGMDPSQVCLISAEILTGEWESYKLINGEAGTFGLSIKELIKVLKYTTDDDTLRLCYNDKTDDARIVIEVEGKERSFKVKQALIDIDADELAIPEIEYSTMIRYEPTDWKDYTSTFQCIEPYTLELATSVVDKSIFTMVGEGESGSMSQTIDLKTKMSRIDSGASVSLSYNLTHQIATIGTSMAELYVCLEQGTPALFHFTDTANVQMKIFLAPKMDENDDE